MRFEQLSRQRASARAAAWLVYVERVTLHEFHPLNDRTEGRVDLMHLRSHTAARERNCPLLLP